MLRFLRNLFTKEKKKYAAPIEYKPLKLKVIDLPKSTLDQRHLIRLPDYHYPSAVVSDLSHAVLSDVNLNGVPDVIEVADSVSDYVSESSSCDSGGSYDSGSSYDSGGSCDSGGGCDGGGGGCD
jgi:uncharacterized membrane protein YgcG